MTQQSAAENSGELPPLPVYKLVVIGDAGVGKSSLTIQFFQKQFVEYYDPTIEDQYIQHCEVDGQWCVMDGQSLSTMGKIANILPRGWVSHRLVLDTAGQEEFSAMREHYMRSGRGFLLVFSVTDPKSYEEVSKFHEQVLRLKDREDYPMLLVGNKVDLELQRKVTEEEGVEMAGRLNCPYIETSAKSPPQNVDAAFHQLVRIVKQYPTDEQYAEEQERQRKLLQKKQKTAGQNGRKKRGCWCFW